MVWQWEPEIKGPFGSWRLIDPNVALQYIRKPGRAATACSVVQLGVIVKM